MENRHEGERTVNQSLAYELAQVMPAVQVTGLLRSTCSFFLRPGGATPTTDAAGQVDLETGEYTPVAGLQAIACMLSVEKVSIPDIRGTVRTETEFREEYDRHLLLDNAYPAVQQQYLVQVDGTFYEVMSVETDSQAVATRCAVRIWRL